MWADYFFSGYDEMSILFTVLITEANGEWINMVYSYIHHNKWDDAYIQSKRLF